MSKITFRADDDLVRRLEAYDASKSEVMREALRTYLDGSEAVTPARTGGRASVEDPVADRVDAVVADRLDGAFTPGQPPDVNVNVTLAGEAATDRRATAEATRDAATDDEGGPGDRETAGGADGRSSCSRCGDPVAPADAYCPNCGAQATRRLYCECGDELRSDWGFCPSCGRRTPAADVLDRV